METDFCVAVPPHKPVITWRGNKVTAGAGVGPYHVGDTLVVTCEVSGGCTFLKIIIFFSLRKKWDKKCENNNWALKLAGKVTAYFSNFSFLFWVTAMRVSSIVKYESNAHLKVHLQAHQRPRLYGGKRGVCTMTPMNWWAWTHIFLKRYKTIRQNG